MTKSIIVGNAVCPWCDHEIDIMRSRSSGYHYATCRYCNGHFRNIPVAMIDSINRDEDEDKGGVPRTSPLRKYLHKDG